MGEANEEGRVAAIRNFPLNKLELIKWLSSTKEFLYSTRT